jgi:endoglucanase
VSRHFSNENRGTLGKDYTYNSERSVAYFAEQGVTLLRVPFRWERIQPRLGQALEPGEADRLKETVAWARRHHAQVILDVHNFGRYHLQRQGKVVQAVIDQRLGDEVPVMRQHFADLWRRLSILFRDEPAVESYGLMNEPHDMGASDWKVISQAAVDAIRAEGDRKRILVCGNQYGNPFHFPEVNGPSAWIKDPADQVVYEAHCYFDEDYSGTYAQSYDAELAKDKNLEYRGVRRFIPFAGWCAANGVRGLVGEFGVPGNDLRWRTVLDHFLQALDRTGMTGCWWAAGEWWGKYTLSLQPKDDFRTPAPQLKWLVK